MGIASWEYNLATGELWWSDNAGPLFGRPRGFIPSGFEEAESLVHPDDHRPRDLDLIVEYLKNGPVETERRALYPDGTVHWTYHRYFLMHDSQGNPERLGGMMRDIDDRKRREVEDDLMLHANEVLAKSLDIQDTLEATANLLVPELADWCVIQLLVDGVLEPVVIAHSDEEKIRWAQEIQAEFPTDMDTPYGSPNVIRTGEAEFYPEITDEMLVEGSRGDPRRLAVLRSAGYRSVVIVPLKAGEQVVGTATLVMAESNRLFDKVSLAFAERLATRMAVFIENARLHSKLIEAWKGQSAVVETLQRGLSPEPLPTIPSVALSAHYEVGGEEKVGGDWYDAFVLPDGLVALVIGDVVGRGLTAVTTMTEYRNALRVLLAEGHGPAEAVMRLNRFINWRKPNGEGFATVACVLFDPQSRSLESCAAGHPPAMLRIGDGVERLWEAADPPLGVETAHEFATSRRQVEAGTMLVLYTDGLIERRSENIDVSLDRLSAELEEAPSAPEAAVKHLLSRLPSYPSKDDVAVLVAQFE